MNWVDVVDTAIKIGLGSAVAGVFALVSAIVTHRHQLAQSREEHLRKTLDTISKQLESTLSRLFSKGMDEARYAEDKLLEGYDPEEWDKRIRGYVDAVDDAIATLSVLDGRLRLYACDAAADKLTDLSSILLALPDKIGPTTPGKEMLDVTLRTVFKEISEKKAAFYKELNKHAK